MQKDSQNHFRAWAFKPGDEKTVSSCLLFWAEGEHRGTRWNHTEEGTPQGSVPATAAPWHKKYQSCFLQAPQRTSSIPWQDPKLCGTIKARKQFQLFTFLQDFKKDRNSSQSFQNILADTYLRTWFRHQSQLNQIFSSGLGTQTLKEKQVPTHAPTLSPSQLCVSLFKSQNF